tara:strand:- start:1872 stop:2249 length:378 start_codon:yes stop_codon:yes gene_type:complete
MKTVKLEVFNGSTQFTKSIDFHSSTGINKVAGTCINNLFQFNSRLRKYGATHFKANEELSIVISSQDDVLIDTYTLNSEYGFKLKFGNTPKSKKRFASCINDLLIWSTEEIKSMTLNELIESFED